MTGIKVFDRFSGYDRDNSAIHFTVTALDDNGITLKTTQPPSQNLSANFSSVLGGIPGAKSAALVDDRSVHVSFEDPRSSNHI